MTVSVPIGFFLCGAGIASIVWAVSTSTGNNLTDTKVPGVPASDLRGSDVPRFEKTEAIAAKDLEAAVLARVDALEIELSSLRESLILEQSSRLNLQRKLRRLEGELLQFRSVSIGDSSQETHPRQSPLDVDLTTSQRQGARGVGQGGAPDLETLLAAGTEELAATEILKRMDERSLAMLELRDLATREGWAATERYTEQRSALRNSLDLRTELGDEGYDRYLYTSGQNNRVFIGSIIDGSAAALAGIEINDQVVRYANQKVYSSRDLQRATVEGERFEPVAMILLRGLNPVSVTVARGPLGVTLVEGRESPISLPASTTVIQDE